MLDPFNIYNTAGAAPPGLGNMPTASSVIAPSVTAPAVSPINPPDTNIGRIPTPEIDAYKEYLRSQPNRGDYQRNKLGKLLAAVAGIAEGSQRGVGAGLAINRNIVDRPYAQAVEDWQGKGGRLKELAGIEVAEEARNREIAEAQRKANLEEERNRREWANFNLEKDYKAEQIQNIRSEVAVRGLSVQKNEKTGELEVIDITGKRPRQSLGQFAESIGERRQRRRDEAAEDYDWWLKKEQVEQGNRVALAGINHANDLIRMDRQHLFAGELIGYRHQLENSGESVLNQNRAFNGAVTEVRQTMPDLYAEVFNPDGTLKEIGERNADGTLPEGTTTSEAMARYSKTLITIANRKLGRDVPSIGLPSGTGPSGRTVAEPPREEVSSAVPEGQDPALRAAAIKSLDDEGLDETDEENIKHRMEELKGTITSQGATLSVALPSTTTPQVALPSPQYDLGAGALFRQFVGPDFGTVNTAGAMTEIQRLEDARRRLQEGYRQRFGTGTIGIR